MGEVRTVFPPAKLIVGLLAVAEDVRVQCLEKLVAEFGSCDRQSGVEPFTFTDYYCEEMGETIYRQYLSFEQLIEMADLPRIKHRTNQIEIDMGRTDDARRLRRRVNIDPGYVNQSKLVLATTKDYDHRIYVADGIFEEVTLHYRRPAGFQGFPWTYPDYARAEVCQFYNKVRDTYRSQIRNMDRADES